MSDDRTQDLIIEVDRLREALTAIIQTPRYQGIIECHRIARAALAGIEVRLAPREKSLGDSIYFGRVMKKLRQRWENRCAYCGNPDGPFQPDHVKPVSRGGSDEIGNLVLACIPCNQAKGAQTATEFGHKLVAIKAAVTML